MTGSLIGSYLGTYDKLVSLGQTDNLKKRSSCYGNTYNGIMGN